MVNDFSARGPNGQNYKLIDKVEAPNGLNPAPIAQGSESTGTLYFDVTGAPPNGVVYNDGLQDILIWTSNVPGASAPGVPPNSSPAPGALPGPAAHSLIRLQISPRATPSGAGRFAYAGILRG